MGKGTSIEWCDHTFNPWWGCVRVSPGCEQCYAETFSKRVGLRVWGAQADRRFFGDKHWAEPTKWNREAEATGERHRVFCASMADVFEDRRDLDEHRDRLWKLIEATPWLDWLLLTKRPENHDMVPLAWQTGSRRPGNVWLGTTTENQEWARKRLRHLYAARWPVVRFISYEPALGPLELVCGGCGGDVGVHLAPDGGGCPGLFPTWVIVGSESGAKARPMNEDWVRSVRDQCVAAAIPFFYKQKLVGRLKVGRPELDGRTWVEFPQPRPAP